MQMLVALCSPCRESFPPWSVLQEAGEETVLNGKEAKSHPQNKSKQGRAALSMLSGFRE